MAPRGLPSHIRKFEGGYRVGSNASAEGNGSRRGTGSDFLLEFTTSDGGFLTLGPITLRRDSQSPCTPGVGGSQFMKAFNPERIFC